MKLGGFAVLLSFVIGGALMLGVLWFLWNLLSMLGGHP